MHNSLVSIIVPAYNIEKYIEKCVISICNQTYKNIEIIIIDDGSTDNTGYLIDQLKQNDNRITVLHKINGGLSDARNKGIDLAKGEYIMFVDGDDYIPNNSVEKLKKIIETEKTDVVIGEYSIGECNKKNNKILIKNYSSQEIIDKGFRGDFSTAAWGKLYRHDLFSLDMRYPLGRRYEDTVIMFRLLKKANCVSVCNSLVYYYNQDESSITHNYILKDVDDILINANELISLFANERKHQFLLNKFICDMMLYLIKISIALNSNYRINEILNMLRDASKYLDVKKTFFLPRAYKYFSIKLGLVDRVIKWKLKSNAL